MAFADYTIYNIDTDQIGQLKADAAVVMPLVGGWDVSQEDYAVDISYDGTLSASQAKALNKLRLKYAKFKPPSGLAIHNFSMEVSGGTLSTKTDAGQNFSNESPGVLRMPSVNDAGYDFIGLIKNTGPTIDDSDLTGVEWESTASVAWGSARPLYIWAINLDDDNANIQLFISAYFKTDANTSPASTGNNYGKIGSLPSDTDTSVFVAMSDDAGLTAADYAGKPMVCLGAIKATKDASNIWTFSALDADTGAGKYMHDVFFAYPAGHGGNAAGEYTATNGPSFPGTEEAKYQVFADGSLRYLLSTVSGGNCTNGTGTSNTQVGLPAAPDTSALSEYRIPMALFRNGGVVRQNTRAYLDSNGYLLMTHTAGTIAVNNTFSNSGDDFSLDITYPVLQ